MRPIHLLLGLVVVLASGASAYVATRLASVPESVRTEALVAPAPSLVDDTSAVQARKTQDKLDMLTARFDAAMIELEGLRNSANRAPVTQLAAVQPESVTNAVVTDQQRAAVLAVLAEDRARQAAEAEAVRVKAEQEAAQRRASRVAKDLNLSPGDEARLADLMVESGKKRQDMFDSMRNGNFDRETARTQMDAFRTWQSAQLTQAFGASIADQIVQSEGDRMFGGGPGGGFGGPGGGNGQGGNGAAGGGRGARRPNGGNAAGGPPVTPPGGGQ